MPAIPEPHGPAARTWGKEAILKGSSKRTQCTHTRTLVLLPASTDWAPVVASALGISALRTSSLLRNKDRKQSVKGHKRHDKCQHREALRVSQEGIPGNQGRLPEEVTTEMCHVDQGEMWVQGTSFSLLATNCLMPFLWLFCPKFTLNVHFNLISLAKEFWALTLPGEQPWAHSLPRDRFLSRILRGH